MFRVPLTQHEQVLHVHVEQAAGCVVEPEVVLGRGVPPIGWWDQRFDPEAAGDRAEGGRVAPATSRSTSVSPARAADRCSLLFHTQKERYACVTQRLDKGEASPPHTCRTPGNPRSFLPDAE